MAHIFGRACRDDGIEHRTTKVKHPWSLEGQETLQWSVSPTNGQVERMNRTIKEATGKRVERHQTMTRPGAETSTA
jgi:hypothetical protein